MPLDDLIKDFTKTFGADSFSFARGGQALPGIEWLSTGIPSLNLAIGGGLPRGRVTEIYGPESSGKTTVLQTVAATTQRAGGQVALIDLEGMDPTWATASGLDLDQVFVANPTSGNQALDMIGAMIKSSQFDLIALDSVAGVVTEKEQEGKAGDATYGGTANLLSQFFRKWGSALKDTRTALLITNQLRAKMDAQAYGEKTQTTGGLALKFWAAVRLKIARVQTYKRGEDPYGSKILITVTKNKVAPPFRKANFDIIYRPLIGVSIVGNVLDLAAAGGLVTRKGAFYSYGDVRIGQGRPAAIEYLEQNPAVFNELSDKVAGLSAKVLPSTAENVQEAEANDDAEE